MLEGGGHRCGGQIMHECMKNHAFDELYSAERWASVAVLLATTAAPTPSGPTMGPITMEGGVGWRGLRVGALFGVGRGGCRHGGRINHHFEGLSKDISCCLTPIKKRLR